MLNVRTGYLINLSLCINKYNQNHKYNIGCEDSTKYFPLACYQFHDGVIQKCDRHWFQLKKNVVTQLFTFHTARLHCLVFLPLWF